METTLAEYSKTLDNSQTQVAVKVKEGARKNSWTNAYTMAIKDTAGEAILEKWGDSYGDKLFLDYMGSQWQNVSMDWDLVFETLELGHKRRLISYARDFFLGVFILDFFLKLFFGKYWAINLFFDTRLPDSLTEDQNKKIGKAIIVAALLTPKSC